MRPLLAHIYEPHRVTYPCYVQPKLNGIRALYQNGCFQSRDQLPFTTGLLDHLAIPLRSIFGPEVILDGELYCHGWPLQRINAAVTPVRQKPTEDTLKVEYHVFDTVEFGKSFFERTNLPNKLPQPPKVYFVRTIKCGTEALANELYAQFVADGYEGMMYRLGDCPYTVPKQPNTANYDGICWNVPQNNQVRARGFLSDKNNRCWHLLKRKDWRDDEFECLNVIEGEGKLKGTLGALEVFKFRQADGVNPAFHGPHFSVGSGLTDAERDHYWANPPIGRLIKVKYLVLSSDGIPLNSTIIAVL